MFTQRLDMAKMASTLLSQIPQSSNQSYSMDCVFAHTNKKKWETAPNGTLTAYLPPLYMNGNSNWICKTKQKNDKRDSTNSRWKRRKSIMKVTS